MIDYDLSIGVVRQLIVATVPDPDNEKRPSIVTDDNIQLLFDIQEKVSSNAWCYFLIIS